MVSFTSETGREGLLDEAEVCVSHNNVEVFNSR